MNLNLDNFVTYVTLNLALMLSSLTCGQGRRLQCNILSRPHPNGLCGRRLAVLHQNVCFLLRRNHPRFFPRGRRSEITSSVSNQVSDLPGYTIADFDLNDEMMGRSQTYKSAFPFGSPEEDSQNFFSIPETSDYDFYPSSAPKPFFHMLTKRSARSKRSLVCECCYRACSVEIIARYC